MDRVTIFESKGLLQARLESVSYLEKRVEELRTQNNNLWDKVKRQQKEISRLNKWENSAKKYAQEVVANAFQQQMDKINELEKLVESYRHKEEYYITRLQEVQELIEMYKSKVNTDEKE